MNFASVGREAVLCRGDLDEIYCDEDRNLTADAPTDPSKLKNPKTILLSYSPQEDTATYEKMWSPYVQFMTQCLGRPMRFLQVHSSAATIEAMRSGRIQMSLLAAGDTPFAVNVAGAVPFAIHGNLINNKPTLMAYHLIMVVRADSPYKTLRDLIGRRVAHVSPSSNSGNLAPRALFPDEGLTPDKDYKVCVFCTRARHSPPAVWPWCTISHRRCATRLSLVPSNSNFRMNSPRRSVVQIDLSPSTTNVTMSRFERWRM